MSNLDSVIAELNEGNEDKFPEIVKRLKKALRGSICVMCGKRVNFTKDQWEFDVRKRVVVCGDECLREYQQIVDVRH